MTPDRKSETWKIEVAVKPELPDPAGRAVNAEIRDRGFDEVEQVRIREIYLLDGEFSREDIRTLGTRIFADPVVHQMCVISESGEEWSDLDSPGSDDDTSDDLHLLEVYRRPGVMDPFEMNIRRAVSDLGFNPRSIRTGRQYRIRGRITNERLVEMGERILSNPAIEELDIEPRPPRKEATLAGSPSPARSEIPLSTADDPRLLDISKSRRLALNREEMVAIREHFLKAGREPTDVELEMIAQTWSEHCKHKTLAGPIDFNGERIDNLLGQTIMQATRDIARPWCLSVFKDNAGVIALTADQAVCFKVETHNHPSAIEPYGGAGTGIGGVIRDVMGTGLAARPILNTDVFCFAPPDTPDHELPPGTLAPRQVFKGVVAGVRDYGNRMGIPTGSGAIVFDSRYVGNPLVYCGTVGILPHDKVQKEARPGDLIVVVGGRTGRDGLGGATFSSTELSEESETVSSGAVQIGNPIEEKRMLDVLLEARDRQLFRCITDCGAGGLSSAVGEMGEELGVELELNLVPLKYTGLSSAEIWLSEAQERMVLAVPPGQSDELQELMTSEDVEMTVLGRFTDSGRVLLTNDGVTVLDLDLEFLHDGLPRIPKKAEWEPAPKVESSKTDPQPEVTDGEILRNILGHPTVASKEWVIRQYDHEVQGTAVLRPLVGSQNDGPSDATVIAPLPESTVGVAISCGINPDYGDIDPYRMAAAGIDEAIRNVVAVGADPDHLALLDNFSWGSAEKPRALGALVLASRACGDLSRAFETPFISGKDSLNNEYRVGDEIISIPHTLLISSIARVPDVTRVVSMDFKSVGHNLYLAGLTHLELGGSYLHKVTGGAGGEVPAVEAATARKIFQAVHRAIQAGLVRACHDLSEGGLAIALAESAFAGGIGAKIQLSGVPVETGVTLTARELLFSESCSRFLIEALPRSSPDLEEVFEGLPFAKVGETTSEPYIIVIDETGTSVLREGLDELKESWQKPLRFAPSD